MTVRQIMKTIKEVNNNSYIKWRVVENRFDRVILTNDYDKGINYSIEVRDDNIEEWIVVKDNLQGLLVDALTKGDNVWDDYKEREQGLIKGVTVAVQDFNYYY